ncbi:MAG TPA: DUF983 domain-containing protein [Cytophagaceae bacterium]|jgi:hypothetical protein|nr:DUF983 domain-containing protein [Cytophagaceae bacterium]
MKKKSTLTAMLGMKCPKCHKGNLFTHSNPYNINKIHKMPEKCPECGTPFELEPGFYTGAMYVNYGFAVLLFALHYIVLAIVLNVSAYVFFGVYIGVLLAICPFMFRYSRVIFLYMFTSYDKNAIEKHNLLNNVSHK